MNASSVLSPPEPAEVLTASPLPQLRRLVVVATDSEVVITGQVSSYYLKQLAQEAALDLTDRPSQLVNQIVVS